MGPISSAAAILADAVLSECAEAYRTTASVQWSVVMPSELKKALDILMSPEFNKANKKVPAMPRFEVVALLRTGCTQRVECQSHSQAQAAFKEVTSKVLYKCILSYQSKDDVHPTLWAETS